MAGRRAQLVAAASRWRARSIQRSSGVPLVRHILPRLAPAQFPGRSPRTNADSALITTGRPIHFPQHGRGELVIENLPATGSSSFDDLVGRCRARQRVALRLSEPPTGDDRVAVLGLVAAGSPIMLAGSGHELDRQLGDELVGVLRSPVPDDDRGRELRSVRGRRLAHDLLVAGPRPPEVSVLLATRRPDDLEGALAQIGMQRSCRLQIVLGLHGDGWPADDDPLLAELPADAVIRRYGSDVTLGEMLGDLTGLAAFELVTKWDDDDWYGVDHVADLVRAFDYSGADLVGKGAEFVRLEGVDSTVRRFATGAESYGWTLAGGTLLTSRSWLDAIGGWPPVPAGVDRALIESTRRAGGVGYRTHGFQYVLRRRAGASHTWAADDAHFLDVAVETRPGLDLEFADVVPPPASGDGQSSRS